MKNLYTIFILLTTNLIFAQEAGKAGELLKNEVKSTDTRIESNRVGGNNKQGTTSINDSKLTQTGRRNAKNNADYRWNYNHGSAEVFLRIPEEGRFSIEIGDQAITNATGKFRFYDLRAGVVPISIYDNNFLIYRSRIVLRNNTRTVLDFFYDEGLYLLGNYPQNNQAYGFNEWDDIWNNSYINQQGNWNANHNGNFNGSYGNQNQYLNVINQLDFSNLVKAIRRDARTDDSKIIIITSSARFSQFTANQVNELVKLLNFESNKLKLAKQLFSSCIDKQNYYLVYGAFNFESSIRDLNNYVTID